MKKEAEKIVLAIDEELKKAAVYDVNVSIRVASIVMNIVKEHWTGLARQRYEQIIEEINNLN